MATDLGLDDLVNDVSKKYLSGFRGRVERLLEAAVKADRNPFNDAATATAAQSTSVSTGQVVAYAGLTAPTGFLECNGAEVSKTQYPDLAAILGTRFGTAAAGKVKLPNATEAAIMGAGGTRVAGAGTAAGSRGGYNTTSLTIANLPEHRHDIDSICEENPGHVHDVTSYPNFGISVPSGWVRGSGGGSNADDGQGYKWSGGSFDFDGGSADQSFWERVTNTFNSIFSREENTETRDEKTGTTRTSTYTSVAAYKGPVIDLNNISTTERVTALAVLSVPLTGVGALGAAVQGGFLIGETARQVFSDDGTRRANPSAAPGPRIPQAPASTRPTGPGSGTPSRPSIPNITPTRPPTNTPTPTYVFVGGGTQTTNANQRTFGNIPDAPSIPTPTPRERPGSANPGAPSPGTNPDDTNRPGSTPTTPGSTGPGSRPNNTRTTTTAPAEDKSTAPPVATRENPFDTTFYTESQREELNKSLQTFYEDYAVRLGSGAAVFSTFIGVGVAPYPPGAIYGGMSYGIVDATASTLAAGRHTHTTSGTMDTTGGGGLVGLQQPSFALMWVIKI